MKANKGVLSALLGLALLAVPITASARARDDVRNRGPVPAYHKVPVVAPRTNFAPRAANDHLWMRPATPIVRVPAREDWRYRDRDNDRPVYSGPIAVPYNSYPNFYEPAPYFPATGYYGAPAGNGVANLIRQRNNAQILYHQAVANGNRDRARHLLNDIIGLNKQIARARA